MKILICDDNFHIRNSLKEILSEEYFTLVYEEASNGFEAYEKASSRYWDIILLDIQMPGKSGIRVLKELRSTFITTPVLILSSCIKEQYERNILEAGASGYLSKDNIYEELITVIKKLLPEKDYSEISNVSLV